jgi:plastocyanin
MASMAARNVIGCSSIAAENLAEIWLKSVYMRFNSISYSQVMKLKLALALTLLAGTSAAAGDLTVDVRDGAGQPLANAVVLVKPKGAAAPTPIRVSWPLVMAQKDIAFAPYVLVAPVGSSVAFPNKDRVRHHVYSFSATKKFELKLYGRDETRTVTFDKPGAVSLGCNIHDEMIAFIYVTDTPYAAKTDATGRVTLRDVPAGASTLTVWHPLQRARAAVVRDLAVAAGAQREAAQIPVRPAT